MSASVRRPAATLRPPQKYSDRRILHRKQGQRACASNAGQGPRTSPTQGTAAPRARGLGLDLPSHPPDAGSGRSIRGMSSP